MRSLETLTRVLLTFSGFVVFLILAVGSDDPGGGGYSGASHYPTAQEIGRRVALSWAESNSPELARKIRQVQARRDHAESEMHRLENMREQFPQDADRTTERIEEWSQVLTELDAALEAARDHSSHAYQLNQRDGKDAGVALSEAYRQWSPMADQAIAHAKKQRMRTDGSEIHLKPEDNDKP
jgi:hypothetical protein